MRIAFFYKIFFSKYINCDYIKIQIYCETIKGALCRNSWYVCVWNSFFIGSYMLNQHFLLYSYVYYFNHLYVRLHQPSPQFIYLQFYFELIIWKQFLERMKKNSTERYCCYGLLVFARIPIPSSSVISLILTI